MFVPYITGGVVWLVGGISLCEKSVVPFFIFKISTMRTSNPKVAVQEGRTVRASEKKVYAKHAIRISGNISNLITLWIMYPLPIPDTYQRLLFSILATKATKNGIIEYYKKGNRLLFILNYYFTRDFFFTVAQPTINTHRTL